MARLNQEKSPLMSEILSNPNSKWMKKTKEVMEMYNIEERDLERSKEFAKVAIRQGIYLKVYCQMNHAREGGSKIRYYLDGKTWNPEEPAKYMQSLTRKEASTIFKARTRMTKFKGNYKNQYPDQTCRACKKHPETHHHALYECEIMKSEVSNSITRPELFSEDTETLKILANKIDNICERLNETN